MCKIVWFPIERADPGPWGDAVEEEYCVQCRTPLEVDWQPDMFVDLVKEKIGFTPETPEGSEQRHWCDNCQEYTVWMPMVERLIEC